MSSILCVGLGGFIGSVLRYLLSGFAASYFESGSFPWGTLCVNLIGCLAVGILGGFADVRQILTPQMRLFLVTGILGGFTTFSAFSYEAVALARDGAGVQALWYVLASTAGGILLAAAGLIMVR